MVRLLVFQQGGLRNRLNGFVNIAKSLKNLFPSATLTDRMDARFRSSALNSEIVIDGSIHSIVYNTATGDDMHFPHLDGEL